MSYLCMKQLTIAGKTYYQGESIPASVILPERSRKLLKSGYLSEQKEIEGIQEKLQEKEVYQEKILISVKDESNGEAGFLAISATFKEIQQVFSIMQQNASDAIEAIGQVKSENVLILLHAADSRKIVKDAAKKQAEAILST